MRELLAIAFYLWCAVIAATPGARAQTRPNLVEANRLEAVVDSLRFAGSQDSALTLAEDYLQRARAQDDAEAILRGTLLTGRMLSIVNRHAEAEPILTEAVALASQLGDAKRRDGAELRLGIALDYQRQFDRAKEHFERARLGAIERDDGVLEAEARQWIARRTLFEGRFDEARAELEWVVQRCEELGEYRTQANSYSLLGITRFQLLDLEGAVQAFERAVEVGRRIGYPIVVGQGLNNLAAAYHALGFADAAADAFEQAYTLHKDAGNLRSMAVAALNVSEARIRLGQLDAAAAVLDEIEPVVLAEGMDESVCAVANNRGMLGYHAGRHDEAIARYRQARVEAHTRAVLDEELKAVLGEARSLVAIDSVTAAVALLREQGLPLREVAGGAWAIQLDEDLGGALLAAGRPAEAQELLTDVAEAATGAGLVNFRLSTLAQLASCHIALDHPDSAVAVLERATRVWEEERQIPLDPRWREQRGERGRQFYVTLAGLRLDAAGAPAQGAAVAAVLDELQRFKARTLRERRGAPGQSLADDAPDLATTADLQALLAPDELFLDAYLGPQTSLLFAVADTVCRVVRLAGSDGELGEKVSLLHGLLANPEGARLDAVALDRACAALGDLLLAQIADLIEVHEHILFSPDGVLGLVPLGALQLGIGAPPLVDARQVRVVPSATVFADLVRGQKSRPSSPRPLLAVAGSGSGGDLPAARREVRTLRDRYEGVQARGLDPDDEATLSEADLNGFGVVHLAAHTAVSDQDPWQSGILLASAATSSGLRAGAGRMGLADVPMLRAQRIAELHLDGDLVVLSGCETAGGRLTTGEGILGLTAAFLSAGVPTVVATLWPVDDTATQRFMSVFYEELAAGRTSAEALRQAQLRVKANPATQSPFYWAGFIAVGEGDAVVPLRMRALSPRVALAWLAVLALAMAVVLVLRARRKGSA